MIYRLSRSVNISDFKFFRVSCRKIGISKPEVFLAYKHKRLINYSHFLNLTLQGLSTKRLVEERDGVEFS